MPHRTIVLCRTACASEKLSLRMNMVNSAIASARSCWKAIPDAPHLRFCAEHRLIAWTPHRVLDDRLLARIDTWLLATEDISPPCNRFIDFSRLTNVSLPIGHAFNIASATAAKSSTSAPLRCALFCDKPIGFAIARLYETLTSTPLIKVRAFRDRVAAAKWLEVPAHVLTLDDEPAPYPWRTTQRMHERHAAI